MVKLQHKSRWSPARLGNARSSWSPPLGLAGSKADSMLGLSILSALSIAGIHSAVNPSYFTLRSFASKPEAKGMAKEGLWIGLGLSTLASLAIWWVFDETVPAVISEATAVALFGIGLYAVNSTPLDSLPAIQNQNTSALPTPEPQGTVRQTLTV
jgi:hypothetical protein